MWLEPHWFFGYGCIRKIKYGVERVWKLLDLSYTYCIIFTINLGTRGTLVLRLSGRYYYLYLCLRLFLFYQTYRESFDWPQRGWDVNWPAAATGFVVVIRAAALPRRSAGDSCWLWLRLSLSAVYLIILTTAVSHIIYLWCWCTQTHSVCVCVLYKTSIGISYMYYTVVTKVGLDRRDSAHSVSERSINHPSPSSHRYPVAYTNSSCILQDIQCFFKYIVYTIPIWLYLYNIIIYVVHK